MKTDFQPIDYEPPPTLRKFMLSDARVRFVRGPVGSAKSTCMVMEFLRRASQQAPGPDGYRRTRGIIVRNTLQQLKSTCLVTIENMLRPVINFKVSDQTVQLRMGDIISDWILLPLDSEENIQRLLSLEATFAWGSEARELNPEIMMSVLSRCGRYPSMMHGGPTWHGLIMESNSFTEDSMWYEILEKNLPANWRYFVQPGATEPEAENVENLAPGYYEDLMASNTPEWVDQYIHNKIGPSLSGQAVFRNSFNREFHVAEQELKPVQGRPLICGMDFARHAAFVIGQMDQYGRLLILEAIHSENMGVERFIKEYVKPILFTERYAGQPVVVIGDPAGIAKGQIGERSVFDVLKDNGFSAAPAPTNKIDPRLRSVESWLIQQRDGKAAILFDPINAKSLILAMQSGYRFKIKKDKSLEDAPEKNHPDSDLADALQYLCLGIGSGVAARVMAPVDYDAAPAPGAAGWT